MISLLLLFNYFCLVLAQTSCSLDDVSSSSSCPNMVNAVASINVECTGYPFSHSFLIFFFIFFWDGDRSVNEHLTTQTIVLFPYLGKLILELRKLWLFVCKIAIFGTVVLQGLCRRKEFLMI